MTPALSVSSMIYNAFMALRLELPVVSSRRERAFGLDKISGCTGYGSSWYRWFKADMVPISVLPVVSWMGMRKV